MNPLLFALIIAGSPANSGLIEPSAVAERTALEERMAALQERGVSDAGERVAQWNNWYNGFQNWPNWRNW